MSRELMQQALEKLEFFAHMKSVSEDTTKLITALRQALVDADDISLESVDETVKSEHALTQATGQWNPLYTAPPKRELTCVCGAVWEGETMVHPPREREWVGLTDEEIALICGECAASAHKTDDISYARAIEAKLKEKNT